MGSRYALVYCTFDGVANTYHGTGVQTQYLLRTLADQRESIARRTGEFDIHIAVPDTAHPCPGYAVDPAVLVETKRQIKAFGGVLWDLPHDEHRLWRAEKWEQLCHGAAAVVRRIVDDYVEVLVIGVDAAFMRLPAHLDELLTAKQWQRVTVLHGFYSSSRIPGTAPVSGRAEMEQECVERARRDERVFLADIGEYFTRHLVEELGADPAKLLPFEQSIDLGAPNLTPQARSAALADADAFNIPLDLPVVFSFSRADPIKGIDRAIAGLTPLAGRIHFVLIAVPYTPHDVEIEQYRRALAESGLSHTYITTFQRGLARSLCSLPETVAVLCSSRGEPVGQVPQEVAMWARDGGPVVVLPDEGGFTGQLEHEVSGLYYPQGDIDAMTACVARAVDMDERERRAMCRAAHDRVAAQRNLAQNLTRTLDAAWTSSRV